MVFERLLSPRYRVMVFNMSKFKPEEIVEEFRRKGAHVLKLSRDIDIELAIESFLASSYGDYFYVLKFPKGRTFLVRHAERIEEKKWPSPRRYIARDENGLKRFLIKEASLKTMLLMEVPRIVIWSVVWLLVWRYFEEYPFGTFLLLAFGFLLSDLSKVLEYSLLGYCGE